MSYEVQRITGDTVLVRRLAELDDNGREVVHMAQHGDVHGIPQWVVVSRDVVLPLIEPHPAGPLEADGSRVLTVQPLEDLSRRARRRR